MAKEVAKILQLILLSTHVLLGPASLTPSLIAVM